MVLVVQWASVIRERLCICFHVEKLDELTFAKQTQSFYTHSS